MLDDTVQKGLSGSIEKMGMTSEAHCSAVALSLP